MIFKFKNDKQCPAVVGNCMKTLITISLLISFKLACGQAPTIISGTLVDEKGNPVEAAMFHYGLNNATEDTSYSDKKGQFKIAYPTNSQKNWYYFYIEKDGFLPKTLFIDLSPNEIHLDTPIVLRTRKGFWYDSKQIDSTHLGITVRQAIQKYKLDINSCQVINEPPGVSRGFRTELGDSSYICLMINMYFDNTIQKMTNVLDSTIIGIGVADTNGNEKYYGRGFVWRGISNPYYLEREMKKEEEEKLKQ